MPTGKTSTKIDAFHELKDISNNTVFFNKAQDTAEDWMYGYCEKLGIRREDFSCLRDRIDAACERGSPEIKEHKQLFFRVFGFFETMAPTDLDGRPVYDIETVRRHYDRLSIDYRKDVEKVSLMLAEAF